MHFIRYVKALSDRMLIRTKPMGQANQALWGRKAAEAIYNRAVEKQSISGRILWYQIPPDMAPVMMRTEFDPYDKALTVDEIYKWLWNHVIFDNAGNVIAIHNRGQIMTCRDGWVLEAGWFSRVRLEDAGL